MALEAQSFEFQKNMAIRQGLDLTYARGSKSSENASRLQGNSLVKNQAHPTLLLKGHLKWKVHKLTILS